MEQEGNAIIKNRDFACACGKKYFSYAALFTHIKQKHDGKAPGPIVRPRSERKRGRPRKTPLPGSDNKNSDSDFGNNSNGFSLGASQNGSADESIKKTQKAAQMLLGSGGFQAFQAFQAYRGDSDFSDQQKKTVLKKVASYTESSTKKQVIKSQKKQGNGFRDRKPESLNIKQQLAQKQEFSNLISQHNISLNQLFLSNSLDLTLQQIQNVIHQKCPQYNTIVDQKLQPKSLAASIKQYLSFTQNLLKKSQHMILNYIMNLFIQFVYSNFSESNQQKLLETSIDQAIKYITEFISYFQVENLGQIAPIQDSHNNIDCNSDENKNPQKSKQIPSQLVADIFVIFTYWVNIYPIEDKPFFEGSSLQSRQEKKKYLKNKQQRNGTKMTQMEIQLKNLMSVENHRQGHNRIINTIEDILAENKSESQQIQSKLLEDEGEEESAKIQLDNEGAKQVA